jgi:Putative prokaryotic signal transducing protein
MAKQPAPDVREWEIVKVVETDQEAVLIAGFLKSNGIPAEVESLHAEELPVNLGALGEVRVRVPRERLAEARRLLATRERGAPGE